MGARTRVYPLSKQIEAVFPELSEVRYSVTSPKTKEYNCIAWAAGDDEVWWWPDLQNTSYWPPQVQRSETRDSFIKAYGTLGYFVCDNDAYEDGFEKIAIYEKNGKPEHAARQLEPGTWTSKLGELEDIEHHSLEGLCGDVYGQVAIIMKREK